MLKHSPHKMKLLKKPKHAAIADAKSLAVAAAKAKKLPLMNKQKLKKKQLRDAVALNQSLSNLKK